jgi:hypothetical protein
LTAEKAKDIGVGFKPRGYHANKIVIPLWEAGELVGYAAYDHEGLLMPKNLTA